MLNISCCHLQCAEKERSKRDDENERPCTGYEEDRQQDQVTGKNPFPRIADRANSPCWIEDKGKTPSPPTERVTGDVKVIISISQCELVMVPVAWANIAPTTPRQELVDVQEESTKAPVLEDRSMTKFVKGRREKRAHVPMQNKCEERREIVMVAEQDETCAACQCSDGQMASSLHETASIICFESRLHERYELQTFLLPLSAIVQNSEGSLVHKPSAASMIIPDFPQTKIVRDAVGERETATIELCRVKFVRCGEKLVVFVPDAIRYLH